MFGKKSLGASALAKLFLEARTYAEFEARPIPAETLRQLYDLLKWGPTAVNSQPARFVFIQSPAGRKRLRPALSPGNVAKVEGAAATAIVAHDRAFFERLPELWTAYDARSPFADDPALAEDAAFRNGTLGGAYLILAARALGLDCGPMSGFDAAKVEAEFFPDGRFKANFLVNLGYGRTGSCHPRGPRLGFEEAVTVL